MFRSSIRLSLGLAAVEEVLTEAKNAEAVRDRGPRENNALPFDPARELSRRARQPIGAALIETSEFRVWLA